MEQTNRPTWREPSPDQRAAARFSAILLFSLMGVAIWRIFA